MNALVLLGGGARGAYQVGSIKAILESGVPIHIVSGSSVGAINAAVVASGQISEMERYWLGINTLDVMRPWVNLLRLNNWQAIARPAESLLRLVREDLDWKTIREGSTRLIVEATNLKTGEHEVFDNQSCTWKHLLASASIPMIFPPVKIGRKYYVDGSLTQTFPLLPAIEAGADTLFVVSLTRDKPDRAVPANLYEMAGRTLEIFLHHSLRHDLQQLEKINELVREKRLKDHRIIRAVTFYPHRDLGDIAQFLLFTREHTESLIDLGYKDGKRVLALSNR